METGIRGMKVDNRVHTVITEAIVGDGSRAGVHLVLEPGTVTGITRLKVQGIMMLEGRKRDEMNSKLQKDKNR